MSQNQALPTVVMEKEEERGKDDKRVGEKREKRENKAFCFVKNECV